jgi:hypothetical protein
MRHPPREWSSHRGDREQLLGAFAR